MPKKKKSYWSVSEIDPSPPPPVNLDRRQTDNLALEKLRCLSAGGAKNPWRIWVIIDNPSPACFKRRPSGAWRVVHYKWSLPPRLKRGQGVLGLEARYNQQSCGRRSPLGLNTTNSPVVGGAPWRLDTTNSPVVGGAPWRLDTTNSPVVGGAPWGSIQPTVLW